MRAKTFSEVRKASTFSELMKFNPYHDRLGRFASGNGGGADSGSLGGKNSEGSGDNISHASPSEFHSAISSAKQSVDERSRWRVDVHEESEYKNDKLFVSKGKSTVAVEPDGNIISVCRKSGDSETKGSDLLKKAVENGGDRLDALGPVLFNFYTRNGFEPVSYTPFDEKYAPEGWKKGLDKPEPVIFYKHTGKKVTISYDEFMNKAKPYTGDDGYQNAKDARDYDMKR